jgi:hypothetical protein
MQDRPNIPILLEAISDFLLKEVLPLTKENEALAYKTLVSWNMLGVISRELKNNESFLNAELERLAKFLEKKDLPTASSSFQKMEIIKSLTLELSDTIRENKICDPKTPEWEIVKQTLREKLEIANPKFIQGD